MFHLFITLVTSYFYPRPPRGGRRKPLRPHDCHRHDFYPRPPRGGRPGIDYLQSLSIDISIHALREEGDDGRRTLCPIIQDFYPRPPRGGRRVHGLEKALSQKISIHALREEGDRGVHQAARPSAISIHALREEGDRQRRAEERRAQHISIHALCEEGDPGQDERRPP